jgi:hypothetical protein
MKLGCPRLMDHQSFRVVAVDSFLLSKVKFIASTETIAKLNGRLLARLVKVNWWPGVICYESMAPIEPNTTWQLVSSLMNCLLGHDPDLLGLLTQTHTYGLSHALPDPA